MTVMAISLFFVGGVSAIEFGFDAPSEVEVEEEFSVSINSEQVGEIYDVKIIVKEIGSGSALSKILWENEWKNSYYFLNGVFPETKTFTLKVTEFRESTEICVKLRKSGETPDTLCKDITISEGGQQQNSSGGNETNQTPPPPGNQTSSGNGGDNGENNKNNRDNNRVSLVDNFNVRDEFKNISDAGKREKIVLNSPQVRQDDNEKSFVSNQEKLRYGVVFSFIAFLILLIILLSLKRL